MASLPLPSPSITKTKNRKHPQCSIQSINANSNLHKGLRCSKSHSTLVKAQLNEVTENQLVNDAEILESKSEGSKSEEKKDERPEHEPTPVPLASEASISEFMTQVSSLVKLVDSRDIVELQMKQSDCELVIRKKVALPQPSVPDNVVMMHSPLPETATPPVFAPAPMPAPISSPTHAPPPSPSVKEKSSLPSLKCPMAGTFYQCPGPGEPPFVKVGDKVQKGQVVCIIEAMKLMNEIEADRSGTIVEVLVDDGKPVSVDTPLFVIEP